MRNPIVSNGKLKAMALVLSLVAWSIVKQITSYNRMISGVPLELILPEGWAVKDRSVSMFDVTFHGTREDLLLLDARSILMNIDLRAEAYEGEKTIVLSEKTVSHTGNSKVSEIDPPEVTIVFDQEVKKRVPVNVNIQGELQLGIRVETADADPKLVTVSGAKKSLDSITSLQTAPVDLTGRIQSFEQRVEVIAPDENWSGKVSPPEVRVKVTLVGVKDQRTHTNIPVQVMSSSQTVSPSGWKRTPEAVNVILQGRAELLEGLRSDQIRAYVVGTDPEIQDAEVQVHVPAGVEVLAILPESVTLQPLEAPEAAPPLPTPAPTEASP